MCLNDESTMITFRIDEIFINKENFFNLLDKKSLFVVLNDIFINIQHVNKKIKHF